MSIKCQLVIQTYGDLAALVRSTSISVPTNPHHLPRAFSAPPRPLSTTPCRRDVWSPLPDLLLQAEQTWGSDQAAHSLTPARCVLKVSKDGVSPPRHLPRGFDSLFLSRTREVTQRASSRLPFSMGATVGFSSHQSLPQQPQPFKGDREGSAMTLASSHPAPVLYTP